MKGKYIAVSDFLSRYPGHDLTSPNQIILIYFQIKELLHNSDQLDLIIEALEHPDRHYVTIDILCSAKQTSSHVKRVIRRTAQPEEVASIRPLRVKTRRLE